MRRIKIKSPANFFYEMNKTFFVGGFIYFQSALTLVVLQWQKSLPDIGGTTIQDVGPSLPLTLVPDTMSNELIL